VLGSGNARSRSPARSGTTGPPATRSLIAYDH
jgi:hypothetical protein